MSEHRNILFIMTDQQRKDSLGCYGNPVCRTPNLDRLAASGVRCERNYVANPICMPSRVCIFTGQTIRNHGLWTNGLLVEPRDTVAGHLSRAGYQTSTIGKLHFTPHGSGGPGNMENPYDWEEKGFPVDWHGPYWGFDHVELLLGQCGPVAHYGEWFFERGGSREMLEKHRSEIDPKCSVMKVPPELHASSFIADRAIAAMQRAQADGQPFFTVASFQDPHAPFNPPESLDTYDPDEVVMPIGGEADLATRPDHYREHFRGEWDRGPRGKKPHPEGFSEAVTRERIAKTYGMIELVDQNVGKLLDYLEREGLREDTAVVFTSDHGELLGTFGLWAKGPFYYDCLINTPLLVSCPSLIEPGVSEGLFSDLDLVPTFCELAGVEPMPFADGVSQLPHLRDRSVSVRAACLVEYRNGYGERDISSKALVTQTHKYVRYQTGEEELTDLANDPEERQNVAGQVEYGELRDELKSRLLDEILSTEAKGPAQLSHS